MAGASPMSVPEQADTDLSRRTHLAGAVSAVASAEALASDSVLMARLHRCASLAAE